MNNFCEKSINDQTATRGVRRTGEREGELEIFRDAFTKEFPNTPKVDQELTVAFAAYKAGMQSLYAGYYRTYSQYTHGALRASIGYLDEVTDLSDNPIMAGAGTAFNAGLALGAASPNREDLIRRVRERWGIVNPKLTGD